MTLKCILFEVLKACFCFISDVGEYYICCICDKRFHRIYFSLFIKHIHDKHKAKAELMNAITDAEKQKKIWRLAKKARRIRKTVR